MKPIRSFGLAMLAAASAALFATGASAATVTFSYVAGPVVLIDPAAPSPLDSFVLGEDILLTVTVDDATADSAASSTRGLFTDVGGTVTVKGLTSGTTVTMNAGVEIEVDDDTEFDLETVPAEPSAAIPFIIDEDVDFETSGLAIFSDVNDLSVILAEFIALIGPDGRLTVNNAAVDSLGDIEFFNGSSTGTDGILFGPVPPAAVPLPATAPLLLGALGLTVAAARRRRRR